MAKLAVSRDHLFPPSGSRRRFGSRTRALPEAHSHPKPQNGYTLSPASTACTHATSLVYQDWPLIPPGSALFCSRFSRRRGRSASATTLWTRHTPSSRWAQSSLLMLAATMNALGVGGINAVCRRLRRRKRNLHRSSSRPCWGCWRDLPSACLMPTLSSRTGQVNPRAAAARAILQINRHNFISLRDSLVLFAQQYSMQNCFLCTQPPSSSSSESPLPDERPCRPLTSLPPSAAAAGAPPLPDSSRQAVFSFVPCSYFHWTMHRVVRR